MQSVSKSGQPVSIGSGTEQETLQTLRNYWQQLDLFNSETLKRPAYQDPGDSKAGAGGRRKRSAGAATGRQ